MIPTGSVSAFMGLDAIAVSRALHNQDVAMPCHLVADSPSLDFWAPSGRADNVNLYRERALPSTLPVRHGRATPRLRAHLAKLKPRPAPGVGAVQH